MVGRQEVLGAGTRAADIPEVDIPEVAAREAGIRGVGTREPVVAEMRIPSQWILLQVVRFSQRG